MSAVADEYPRLRELVGDGDLTVVADGFGFLEGPVWDGERLLFSDIPGDAIHQLRDGVVAEYRRPSAMTNGNALDREGRLISCQHATSRLVREEHDGTLTVLASHWQGAELNSPNDVVVARDGTIVFTDPTYGRTSPEHGVLRPLAQAHRSVYAIAPDGTMRCIADDFIQPNGLAFAADESALFVNDTEGAHIRRFAWRDGVTSGGEVWADVTGPGPGGPDGMKVRADGTVYCTGPGGVHAFSASGEFLGVIRTPKVTANFCWGGPDLGTLYLCAQETLYALGEMVLRAASG